MTVIDDEEAKGRADEIRRLVFCTGKVAVDLLTSPKRADARAVAVCRVEQLYPLPINEMVTTLDRYPHLEEVLWVQEEPENMGAWDFVRPALEGLVGTRRLAVLARPRSSSPAEGSAARHARNQERLITRAFEQRGESSPMAHAGSERERSAQ
jgi:2-oxoglutarate dehydrogenase E1 component